MTKKKLNINGVEPARASLATIKSDLEPGRVQRPAEQASIQEGRKLAVIMYVDSIRTQYGEERIREIAIKTAEVVAQQAADLEEIRSRPRDKQVQEWVDPAIDIIHDEFRKAVVKAGLTGARNIGESINRDIYADDDLFEKKGFWARLFGG